MFEQLVDEPAERRAVVGQQSQGLVLRLPQEPTYLEVYGALRVVGVRGARRLRTREELRVAGGVADRPEVGAQPELDDHAGGERSGSAQIVGSTGGALSEHDELGSPAAEPDCQRVGEVALGKQVSLCERELFGDAQGHAGGEDRHLGDGVRGGGQCGDQCVACLVHGNSVPLFGQQDVRAVPTPDQDAIPSVAEVLRGNHGPVMADGENGRLVQQVREVGAGESGGSARGDIKDDVRAELLPAGMDGQDRSALGVGGQGDGDLTVEPARAQQGRIKGLRPVGGGQDDDIVVVVEAVHLGQELVQGLLPLVVATEALPPAATDGVDLVDEDDGPAALAGISEQIPDP